MADRWLTFDCFGTLIDWRHGIRTTGELLFPGHGAAFLDAYITLEAEVEVPAMVDTARLEEDLIETATDLGLEVSFERIDQPRASSPGRS